MALPGLDPTTGVSTANPLDPTNPAAPTYAAPAPIDLTAGVGLTGADNYNVQRLTRAQTYLQSATASAPDLSAAVGLAPTDWTTMDQHIQALGGQPGHGAGVGQLLDQMMQTGTQTVPVADIRTLKTNMIAQGFLPPGTPITGTWDSNSAAAFKAMEDKAYNDAHSGIKAGGAGPLQFLQYLNDVLPSKVGQALVGTAKFLVAGIEHSVQRTLVETQQGPGELFKGLGSEAASFLGPSAATAVSPLSPQTQAALQAQGLKTGPAATMEDLSTMLSVLPILRGAGVLTSGIGEAATTAAEQGLLTPAEGATAKGLVASSVRTLTAKAADSPTAVGDLLNSYATRPLGLRSLGEGFLNTADQLASYKESALGQGVTAGLNALTQTAVGERAVANLTSGTIAPNIKLGTMERSALGQAIDNTPTLGHSWSLAPVVGETAGRLLGNPLDLSAWIWAPSEALPSIAKGAPGVGEMSNSLERITPTDQIAPILRLTGQNRQQFIDSLGGEAPAEQFVRYTALQAAINRDATMYVRDVQKLSPGDDGWAAAVKAKAQDLSGTLKADPLKMEAAIASAAPVDLMHQFTYMFADNPEVLARRGQGAPVLGNFMDTYNALRGSTAADATVDPFVRGQGLWTAGNTDEINSAVMPLVAPDANLPPIRDAEGNILTSPRPGEGSLPASKYAFAETMRDRLGQAIGPDATIAVRRADNALGSAQQLGWWKTGFDRLRAVATSLDQRIAETDPASGVVEVPKLTQVGDLTAAGFQRAEVDAMRNPDRTGLTSATMTVQQAQQLADHIASRVAELRSKMGQYYEETVGMDDKALSHYAGNLFLQAPRDVTLADDTLHSQLLGLGYQPIALHPDAITINDVGAGTADGLANAGSAAPYLDHVGLKTQRATDEEVQFMRMQSTLNELKQAGIATGIGNTGEEVLSQVRDGAQQASLPRAQGGKANILGIRNTTVYATRELSDLRQMTPAMLQKYSGFTPEQAWEVYGAIRRGAAFGFDASRPISTLRSLGEALRYDGAPGFEDAVRTIVGARGRLPDFIQGPAGHILNLPDDLVKVRDWLRFSANPYMTTARAFKTKILRGVSGLDLPFDFRPGQRIADMAAESGNSEEFMQRFTDNYTNVVGPKGARYAALQDHPDFGVQNPGQGMFGWSNTHGEALDAWHMAQRIRADSGIGPDVDLTAAQNGQIRSGLQKIYGYPNRSALEKTANYFFYPLSFNLKVGKALGGWMLQEPARILMANMGLQAYNQANGPDNTIGSWVDRYLPVVAELNKLNFFAHGFGTGISPIGGVNQTLWNLGKDVNAIIQQNPRLGAYVPISTTDENLPSALGLMANLIPAWRQLQTSGPAVIQQIQTAATAAQHGAAALGVGTAPLDAGGSKAWQVDNYYTAMDDLKRAVAIKMGSDGLSPSFSALTDPYGNKATNVSQAFYDGVMSLVGEIDAKYPAGAAFAKARSLDNQTRSTQLEELAHKPVKSRAEASILYFAAAYYALQAQAQTSARAMNANSLRGRQLYQQIAGAMASGAIPPTLPGALNEDQVQSLRSLAQELSGQAGSDFDRRYNAMFRGEIGPLTAISQPSGAVA